MLQTLACLCVFVVFSALRRSSAKTDLAGKSTRTKANSSRKLLSTPAGNRLSRSKEIWEARRKRAKKDIRTRKLFVPKGEATAEPEYDGYSRRGRHHLASTCQEAEEVHIDKVDEPSMTSIEFESKEHAPQR